MINLRRCRDYLGLLSIRTKDGKVTPLRLNEPQKRFYDAVAAQWREKRPVRVIVLKARQEGFSTLTEGILFWACATQENTDALVIAHKEDATANLFRMTRLYYDTLPEAIKPMRAASNAQEIVFDRPAGAAPEVGAGLRSRIRCATAGGQGVGRSDTLRAVHMSEFAFWPGDKLATYTGIMQAVPDLPGTIVIIESTANGYDAFKDLWDAAVQAWESGERDGFMPLFFPWYEMESYRRPVPENFQRTPEEEKLARTYGLDDAQLSWRRWCIKTNCGGDAQIFRQEYPATPDEAFLATGTCVFDKQALALRRAQVKDVRPERGRFAYDYDDTRPRGQKLRDIRWEPDAAGEIRIYAQPEAGVPYVLGGDTAGDGSDAFTGQVLDNRTGAQAAVLQQQLDETEYTRQMYCLGTWYNTALMGIEINYSTYPQKELERLGYKRFYVRERVDTYTGAVMQAYGWETTSRTRPLMIDNLKAVARENLELIGDWGTLGEMLTFVYDERRRPAAELGKHDDLVMALAIAHQIRPQQRYTRAPKPGGKTAWTKTMWEDYWAADAAQRAYLRKRWGEPEE